MKKSFVLIFALSLAATIVHAQAGWVALRGDNRISVKFPTQPDEKMPGSFIAALPDSSVAFVFTIVDFMQVANVDSVALAPVKATPEFAAQLKTGFASKLDNVSLSDFQIGNWNGFTSYSASGTDPKRKRYDMFMFIIGNKLYSLSTVTVDGASLEGRDKFFHSIMLSN
jgi:hypothetical protein